MQKLTEEQREHWSTIGYIKLEGALKPDEVAYLSGQLAGSGKASHAHACFFFTQQFFNQAGARH